MYRLVKGNGTQASLRHLQMTTDEGGAISDFWLVSEVEDGPPIGFGTPETMTTIFGGLDAQERAHRYLELVTIEHKED